MGHPDLDVGHPAWNTVFTPFFVKSEQKSGSGRFIDNMETRAETFRVADKPSNSTIVGAASTAQIHRILVCVLLNFVIQSEPMKTILRSVAALELLFVFPAVLFMTALFARSIQPLEYEPAHSAQRIVAWYAASPHIGLWVLLIALPLAVVVIGSATLIREWHSNKEFRVATMKVTGFIRSQTPSILIATATATALGILAIVALHVLTD